MKTSFKTAFVAIGLALTLSGCTWPPPPRVHIAQPQITQHRDQWAKNMPTHYQFDVGVMCFCTELVRRPVTFEVKDGVAVSMRYADGTEVPAELKEVFAKHDTIDKVFGILQSAATRNAAEIKVTYDDALGYPTEVAIDMDRQMVDEEISYLIANVKAL